MTVLAIYLVVVLALFAIGSSLALNSATKDPGKWALLALTSPLFPLLPLTLLVRVARRSRSSPRDGCSEAVSNPVDEVATREMLHEFWNSRNEGLRIERSFEDFMDLITAAGLYRPSNTERR